MESISPNIISIFAIIVSAISLVFTLLQNKKLHNENQRLQSTPALEIDVLIESKILGQFVTKKDSFDEITVFKSKYSDLYTNHDIHIDDSAMPLLTVTIKNSGNGVANNIVFRKVCIKTDTEIKEFESDKILFSCGCSEIKANHIFYKGFEIEIQEIYLYISYTDILNKEYNYKIHFIPNSVNCAEMQLIEANII